MACGVCGVWGHKVVKDNALYNTYESFYNSGSQSWRIKKYGTVCIVADAFLGAVVSSGTGTALTTLAEVRLGFAKPPPPYPRRCLRCLHAESAEVTSSAPPPACLPSVCLHAGEVRRTGR